MVTDFRILSIRIRAIAQATEVDERVLKAVVFASGTENVSATRTEGHFGNSITVFEAELKKTQEIRKFISGIACILPDLRGQADARTDEGCNFHFRLDKQKAYAEKLMLASDKDVIDVRIKIGVYPARREEAVRLLSGWLDSSETV